MDQETKPLLFIDTVQTHVKGTSGQSVFDSRRPPKQLNNKEEKTEAIQKEEVNVMPTTKKQRSSKVWHQVRLLDRRYRQQHYVYIQLKLEREEMSGYFDGLVNETIRLKEGEVEREIAINDIQEIRILKV